MVFGLQFTEQMQQETSKACIADVTPPVGGVVQSIVNQLDGSLKVNWNSATDDTSPVLYKLYIKKATAVGIIDEENVIYQGPATEFYVCRDAEGFPVIAGETYFASVRAIDRFGNENANNQFVSVTAQGIGYANLVNQIINSSTAAFGGELVIEIEDSGFEAELSEDSIEAEISEIVVDQC